MIDITSSNDRAMIDQWLINEFDRMHAECEYAPYLPQIRETIYHLLYRGYEWSTLEVRGDHSRTDHIIFFNYPGQEETEVWLGVGFNSITCSHRLKTNFSSDEIYVYITSIFK